MTTRTCLAKLIPALWSNSAGLLACVVLCGAAPAGAQTHTSSSDLARLALGIAAYERNDYSAAIAALKPIQSGLPQIADYTAYYLAAARVGSNDVDGVAKDLAPAHAALSP